jgi:hypothetical protein
MGSDWVTKEEEWKRLPLKKFRSSRTECKGRELREEVSRAERE